MKANGHDRGDVGLPMRPDRVVEDRRYRKVAVALLVAGGTGVISAAVCCGGLLAWWWV